MDFKEKDLAITHFNVKNMRLSGFKDTKQFVRLIGYHGKCRTGVATIYS